MKKVVLLGVVLVSMVSCSKEYTCTCESTYENSALNTSETYTVPVSNVDDALSECKKRADEIKSKNTEFGIKDVKYTVNLK